MQSAFNFVFYSDSLWRFWYQKDMGLNLPLTSNYTLNIWITSSFTEITIKKLRIQVFGNRDCIKMRWVITLISQLSWCSNKVMCVCVCVCVCKRAFKTLVPNKLLSILIYSYYINSHDNLLCMELSGGRNHSYKHQGANCVQLFPILCSVSFH